MSNRALARAALNDSRSTIVENVYRHHRRAFRATVTFQWADSKLIFKGTGHALRKFFRAPQHATQAGEVLSWNAAGVGLQERRSGNHETHAVLPRQFADN